MTDDKQTAPEQSTEAGGRAEPLVSRSLDDVRAIIKMHGFGDFDGDDSLLQAVADICTRLRTISAAADAFVRKARKQGIVGD